MTSWWASIRGYGIRVPTLSLPASLGVLLSFAWLHHNNTAGLARFLCSLTARHPRPLLPSPSAGCSDGKTQCGATSCTGGDTCCKTDNTPGKVCGEACIGDDQCCTTENKPGKLCGDVCINTETQVRPVALAKSVAVRALECVQSDWTGWPGAAPDPSAASPFPATVPCKFPWCSAAQPTYNWASSVRATWCA